MTVSDLLAASEEWGNKQNQAHCWAPRTQGETQGQQAICQIKEEMEQFLNNITLGGKM